MQGNPLPDVIAPLHSLIASSRLTQTQKREGLELILRILGNILENPDEEKFRQVDRNSPTYQSRILCDAGTDELEKVLEGCGFLILLPDSTATDEVDKGLAVWIMSDDLDAQLEQLRRTRDAIQQRILLDMNSLEPPRRPISRQSSPQDREAARAAELRALREEQARRFASGSYNASSSGTLGATRPAPPVEQPRQRVGGVRGFFDNLLSPFRGSSEERRAGNQSGERLKTMTLKDLPGRSR